MSDKIEYAKCIQTIRLTLKGISVEKAENPSNGCLSIWVLIERSKSFEEAGIHCTNVYKFTYILMIWHFFSCFRYTMYLCSTQSHWNAITADPHAFVMRLYSNVSLLCVLLCACKMLEPAQIEAKCQAKINALFFSFLVEKKRLSNSFRQFGNYSNLWIWNLKNIVCVKFDGR